MRESNRPNLRSLTSLRFLAALGVALYHIPFTFQGASSNSTFDYGFLGVNFFFILSGFVISYTTPEKNFRASNFYLKRAARILPSYYLFTLVWGLLFFHSWGNLFIDKVNSGIATLTLTQSLFNGPLYNLGWNPVGWTISVELVFYLLFPFIRRRYIYIYITSAFILLAIFVSINGDNLLSDTWPNFFYFNPIARLAEFSFGILICNLHLKLRGALTFTTCSILQIISVCAVVISILKVTTFQHALQINMFMLIPFGLLILVFSFQGILSRLIDRSIFVFFGEISFVFYLVHHSVFRLFDGSLGAFISPLNMRIFFALVIALTCAAIIHTTFELPIRQALVRRFVK